MDIGFTSKDWKKFVREEGSTTTEPKNKVRPRVPSKARGNATRKTPLYHNCQLQAPDGQVYFVVHLYIVYLKIFNDRIA